MNELSDNQIEEWKSLREEIARKQTACERITLSTVGANLAIYSFALQSMESISGILVLLLPPLVASVAYYWILTHFHSARRISIYLRSILEPDIRINWEKKLQELRLGDGQSGRITPYEIVSWSFYVVSFFSLVWSLCVNPKLQNHDNMIWPVITVFVVLLVIGIIWYFVLKDIKSQISSLPDKLQKND